MISDKFSHQCIQTSIPVHRWRYHLVQPSDIGTFGKVDHMAQYKTPGIYQQNQESLTGNTNVSMNTVPAFIGITKKTTNDRGESIQQSALGISNIDEYIHHFGLDQSESFTIEKTPNGWRTVSSDVAKQPFYLYQALSIFFENGGKFCYVISIASTQENISDISPKHYIQAIDLLKEIEDVTLICTPESVLLGTQAHYDIQNYALQHCALLKNRMVIIDVRQRQGFYQGHIDSDMRDARSHLSGALDYGAAYYPYLRTSLARSHDQQQVKVNYELTINKLHSDYSEKFVSIDGQSLDQYGYLIDTMGHRLIAVPEQVYIRLSENLIVDDQGFKVFKNNQGIVQREYAAKPYGIFTNENGTAYLDVQGHIVNDMNSNMASPVKEEVSRERLFLSASLDYLENAKWRLASAALYREVKAHLNNQFLILPPSAAVMGAVAFNDTHHGVWRPPGNIELKKVLAPVQSIDRGQQQALNVDSVAGKSINAIRYFVGKGSLIWGVRTLRGNDNEWRYISVRRLFIMVEQWIKKSSAFSVFEENTPFTWLKLKTLIENYLEDLWRQGALLGDSPQSAFFINVGLGQTMTEDDIHNGITRIEVGLAAIRPAEFIILTFSTQA